MNFIPPHQKPPKTKSNVLNMLPAGDLRDRDTLGAGLGVHVALVVVRHAVGRAREVGLPLAPVPALADGLAVPDVALGALLRAHELVAGGPLRHADGALVALDVDVARRHAALVAAHVGAALLERLAVLGGKKRRGFSFFFLFFLQNKRKL